MQLTRISAEVLGLEVAEVEDHLARHWSFPTHTYHEPRVYEFELEAIFSRRWQYFAPVERLAVPGDVVIGTIGEIPIVVTRGEDELLHGFVNICRHRGYQVVKADCHHRRLVCGYHGWTYRLDGSLEHARDTQSDPSFCNEDFSLMPVAVEQWAQGVFVNPQPNAGSLRDAHPKLAPLAEEGEFDTDATSYTLQREIVTPIEANWKLWYDNGVECYHCPLIHGESFSEAFNVDPKDTRTLLTDSLMSWRFQPTAANSGEGLRSQNYCSFQLFPGCQIVQQDDMMYMARIVPTGPESCRFIAHYFAQNGADLERVDAWIALWNQTFEEDREAAEIQQKGLRTGRLPRMRYVGAREEPVLFFNGLIWDAYKNALGIEAPRLSAGS